MQGEGGVSALLKEFNKDINAQIKELSVKKKKAEDGKDIPYNLSLKPNNFRNAIPKEVTGKENSFNWLSSNTDAIIAPNVRNRVRGTMVSTDTAKIDSILGSILDAKETQQETTKVIQKTDVKKDEAKQSLDNNAVWLPLFRGGLENTPKSILYDIAEELVNNDEIAGEDIIAKRKRLILENPQAYATIQEMITEIKTNISSPESLKQADPSDNQYELQEIDKLETQLDDLRKQKIQEAFAIRSQKTLQGGESNPKYVKSVARRRGLALNDAKQDEEIIELQRRIDDLQSDTTFKIINEDFDGRDAEDINVFKDWLKANLPDYITVKDIDGLASRLKNKGITAGAFIMNLKTIAGKQNFVGQIYTNKSNSFRYHEAFHATFRMLLTDEEIQTYLKIGKKGLLAQ